MTRPGRWVAVCADVGSTFTKAAAVDLADGTLLGTAERPTTVETDVLDGLDAAIAALPLVAKPSTVDVCSSAGGGLRLAVVGYERLVTAEAGTRVGLSAGARVVHVAAGRLDRTGLSTLDDARPDVILLVGGTDGGDSDVLLHNAAALRRTKVPVVVAGNAEATPQALALLGRRAVGTDNVLPRIGELRPEPARAAIRDVFLRHVIGGKQLSRGRRFASLVRGATPDIVLTAAELLGELLGGDVLVVDVGGATTDVYSVLVDTGAHDDVAGTAWHGRTVEGDLGVRWSAPSLVAAAVREGLLTTERARALEPVATMLAGNPGLLPLSDPGDGGSSVHNLTAAEDALLFGLAATIAVRRHARTRDLRRVRLVIGSGGVARHQRQAGIDELHAMLNDHAGGWALPAAASVAIDTSYRLAPAGLLAARHRDAARSLLAGLIADAQ